MSLLTKKDIVSTTLLGIPGKQRKKITSQIYYLPGSMMRAWQLKPSQESLQPIDCNNTRRRGRERNLDNDKVPYITTHSIAMCTSVYYQLNIYVHCLVTEDLEGEAKEEEGGDDEEDLLGDEIDADDDPDWNKEEDEEDEDVEEPSDEDFSEEEDNVLQNDFEGEAEEEDTEDAVEEDAEEAEEEEKEDAEEEGAEDALEGRLGPWGIEHPDQRVSVQGMKVKFSVKEVTYIMKWIQRNPSLPVRPLFTFIHACPIARRIFHAHHIDVVDKIDYMFKKFKSLRRGNCI
jgi:hypothetical protein